MGYELIGKISVLNDTEANIENSTGTIAEMRFANRSSDNALGISIDNGTTWNFLGNATGSSIQIFDNSVFKVTSSSISFDSNLTVASTGTVAFISSVGGSETSITSLSGTSIVTGWSDFIVYEIYYKKVNNLVTIWFNIEGTSNDSTTNFTVPAELACVNAPGTFQYPIRVSANGTYVTGLAVIGTSKTRVDFYATLGGGSFASSSSKTVNGTIIYAVS